MSKDCEYTTVKAAREAFSEAKVFFEEFEEAQRNKRATPIYNDTEVVGFNYINKNGEEKTVSKEEIKDYIKKIEIGISVVRKIIIQS